jgi:ribosome silencing factor RsfS/YbeB/iojap
MTTEEMLTIFKTALESKKAEDIVIIDMTNKTAFAEYMIIASGNTGRQLHAMAKIIREKASELNLTISVEGLSHSDWVLIDLDYIVIHLFKPEARRHYNLEKMWSS